MAIDSVICSADEVSASWLSEVLKNQVSRVKILPGRGNWSHQLALDVELADGTRRALRLKICLGEKFGRSEVDYYTRDYVGLASAPLVRCLDAQYVRSVGYHILLDDLTATHQDRRDTPPTLAYGRAVAEALGRLHKHHWESCPAPSEKALNRYLDEIRPGINAMELATGLEFQDRFVQHEKAFRLRWTNPLGMSLLHGDLNPTNILTPNASASPVYFLDRQPFDWSLTYGVAVYDLAYFLVPWWPVEARRDCQDEVLRHWYDSVDQSEYTWQQAQADWRLSVEQCLDIPLEWCSKAETASTMRWLWETQLARVQAALTEYGRSDT